VNNGASGLALVANGGIALDITQSQTYFASQRSLKLTAGTTIYENPTSTGTLSIGQNNDASGTMKLAHINLNALASYASNAAAILGGLVAGDLYMVTASDPRQVAIVF
jgi:hypothetical protein